MDAFVIWQGTGVNIAGVKIEQILLTMRQYGLLVGEGGGGTGRCEITVAYREACGRLVAEGHSLLLPMVIVASICKTTCKHLQGIVSFRVVLVI